MADRSLRTGAPAAIPLLITFVVAAVIGGLVAGVFALAGGGADESTDSGPSTATLECRDRWSTLTATWEERAAGEFVSDLAPRWSALAANADLMSTTSGDDCDEAITAAERTAADIENLSDQVRRFDMVYVHEQISAPAEAWLAGDPPKARAKRVRAALKVLAAQGPLASEDMAAGWQGAVQTDLADEEAVQQLLSEMSFLANDSVPYRTGAAALSRIDRQMKEPVSRR